ncbi:MAG: CHC2 zinc finger domain-containing protein [Sphingomonas sp.]
MARAARGNHRRDRPTNDSGTAGAQGKRVTWRSLRNSSTSCARGTPLSGLIGRSVKLTKAGNEHKGCCPFHSEKTPSFTVSDDKGFAHCFGCSWHGDAIKWLMETRGLDFLDVVRELAAAAGMDMPARSADEVRRESAALEAPA